MFLKKRSEAARKSGFMRKFTERVQLSVDVYGLGVSSIKEACALLLPVESCIDPDGATNR